jgi:hypothetical protein
MTIEEYLSSSRKLKPQNSFDLNPYYSHLFERILDLFEIDLTHINLEIVYSNNKTAELLRDFQDKTYLVYDQYLGQCFNMLNRIYFNGKEKEIAHFYSFKILAEEFQIFGFPDLAQIFGLSYIKEMENYSSYKNDQDPTLRNIYTLIQEAYVIVHELAHYIITVTDAQKLRARAREMTIEIFEHQKTVKSSNDDTIFDQYMTDFHNTITEGKDTYKDRLTNEQISNLKEDFLSNSDNYEDEAINYVKQNDNIIEELVCDELAFFILIDFFKDQYNIQYDTVIHAMFVGMMNLRVLGIIHNQANDFINDTQSFSVYFKENMIRLTRIRTLASIYAETQIKKESAEQEIHRQLSEINVKYTNIISDSILFLTQNSLQKLKKNYVIRQFNIDEFIRQNELVDNIFQPRR